MISANYSIHQPVIILDFFNVNTRLRHDQPARFLRKGVAKAHLGLIFVEIQGVLLQFPEERIMSEDAYAETGRKTFDYK